MRLPFRLRIGTTVDPSLGSGMLEARSRVWSRQGKGPDGQDGPGHPDTPSHSSPTKIIVAVVVVGVIVVLVAAFLVLRILRGRHPNAKYIPTPFLKKLWTGWKVPAPRGRYAQAGTADDDDGQQRSHMRGVQDGLEGALAQVHAASSRRARNNSARNAGAAGDSVDRNTSIRSVMTLPAYRPKATETEQVLGREGERDGIDTVVELPTAEVDEALRDEEMEALYQIRQTRRRQLAEREERRRLRREARERHDALALEELRRRTREATAEGQTVVADLRSSHERIKQTRQRAVSSVSYADVGIARHDGTRIRANSSESERVGLLSDAASMATAAVHRQRAPSASSVLSIDAVPGHSPGGEARSPRASTGGRSSAAGSARAGSSPELIDAAEADLGGADMPPGYDDVSLGDAATPRHSRSGANSPYAEPPPDYPGGPTAAHHRRLSAHVADLVAETVAEGAAAAPPPPPRSTAQLPGLSTDLLPQIVIEPSSAAPRDDDG